MKKSFIFILTMTVALVTAYGLHANGNMTAGFEASGHIFTGAGWQRFKTLNGAQAVTADINSTVPGVIGEYLNTTNGSENRVNTNDVFRFFLDEVELDIAKKFGENIRARADLDFGSATLYSGPRFSTLGGGNVFVEQAYATFNINWGNGFEALVGRFNAPIGFESVDVSDNDTISRSGLYRSLRPHHFTGAKFYYAFSDAWDWHMWVVNNGFSVDDGDVLGLSTDIPAVGGRVDYKWGGNGKESHIGLSGVGLGQDHQSRKQNWTFLGDFDFQWWASDNFALGGEGIYRQINRLAVPTINGKYVGGLLNAHYVFNDLWDGTIKYAYTNDINGNADVIPITGLPRQSLTGADQYFHEGVLATNYSITDGAKLRLEGSYAFNDPSGLANNRHVFGFGGGFAYSF